MPVDVILGGQWGDEGKGKVVDYLAQDADAVIRFSGGNNAGHTVINEKGEFKFHLLPVGVTNPNISNFIGNGVVINPDVFIKEVEELTSRLGYANVFVSELAHIIMPYHIARDRLEEQRLGVQAIGTTISGIGPCYSEKVARRGIRMSELKNLETLKPKIKELVEYHNKILEKVYGSQPFKATDIYQTLTVWADKLLPYITQVGEIIRSMLAEGKKVILEGAQGALLDVDYGTYPFVTSSNPTVGGAITGSETPFREISEVIGVFKAYCTRVGSGPFPTELFGEEANTLRKLGNEFGTTTGRPRRVGWFDAVAAKYTTTVNQLDSFVFTRIDILDNFDDIKICVDYKYKGERLGSFPTDYDIYKNCHPIYQTLEGWKQPTFGVTNLKDLPLNAHKYLDFIIEKSGIGVENPIKMLSTGPKRHHTLLF